VLAIPTSEVDLWQTEAMGIRIIGAFPKTPDQRSVVSNSIKELGETHVLPGHIHLKNFSPHACNRLSGTKATYEHGCSQLGKASTTRIASLGQELTGALRIIG